MQKEKWYKKPVAIVVLIFVFFPVGLFLMWKYTNWSKGVKIAITAFIVIAAFFSIPSSPEESGEPATEIESTTIAVETTKKIDKEVRYIMDAVGLTEAEASAVLKDLKAVGVGKLTSCEYLSGETDKSFKAYDGEYGYIVVIIDKKTDSIFSGDLQLFSASKGGAIDNIKNYHLTMEEETQFIVYAKTWVEETLLSPSTAKYPLSTSVSRNKDTVTVSSYVDSQNAFGAVIRNDFIVQISYSSRELIYLQVGGKALYGAPVTTN